ncbi:MAG TPA: integrase [Oribacterium sp.]|nr:integrase [Oribacterium sp.]
MRELEHIEDIRKYRLHLLEMEKSAATIEKYLRDIRKFSNWLGADRKVTKERVIEYKHMLTECYKTSSVNSMLVALNMYFRYLGWEECCVRGLKCQRQMFTGSQKELRQDEYLRLVKTALQKGQEQIALVMETIASTGIRISELRYITVEAVQQGCANVSCKGKFRQVFIVKKLRKKLTKYQKCQNIESGPIFLSQKGNLLDRSNVWAKMKKIAKIAGVNTEKVFPHNFRHLFARAYYLNNKDIFYLADILGHASVNTTRIYTRTAGENHLRMLEKL